MTDPTIQHISDTARWAAVYRARETESKNALFRDPFARLLAGKRGEEIAKATPFHEKHSWSWVTRTYLFDSVISEQVAQGADMVANLAAGLDTRPYRMRLPASLKWVEVDLPEILDYKEEVLKAEKPVCSLERCSPLPGWLARGGSPGIQSKEIPFRGLLVDVANVPTQ